MFTHRGLKSTNPEPSHPRHLGLGKARGPEVGSDPTLGLCTGFAVHTSGREGKTGLGWCFLPTPIAGAGLWEGLNNECSREGRWLFPFACCAPFPVGEVCSQHPPRSNLPPENRPGPRLSLLAHRRLGAGWGRLQALPGNSQQGTPRCSETKWPGSSLSFFSSQCLLSSSSRSCAKWFVVFTLYISPVSWHYCSYFFIF